MSIVDGISILGTGIQLLIVVVGVYIVAKLAQNSLDTITKSVDKIEKKIEKIETKVEHLVTNVVTEMKEDISKLKGQIENICKYGIGDCNDE